MTSEEQLRANAIGYLTDCIRRLLRQRGTAPEVIELVLAHPGRGGIVGLAFALGLLDDPSDADPNYIEITITVRTAG